MWKVHVQFIGGLNQPADGPLLGLRAFGDAVAEACGGVVTVGYSAWNLNVYADLNTHWPLEDRDRVRLVLVGHSLGGDVAHALAVGVPGVDSLFLLDPVPREKLWGLFADHYKIPAGLAFAVCWRRSFWSPPWGIIWSKRIRNPNDKFRNVTVRADHNAIPALPQVHAAIAARIAAAAA